jgi:hypothetical protein
MSVLMHASQTTIMADNGSQDKKKARRIPEPLGRDALGLMIDDCRLMIVTVQRQYSVVG